jgi:flavodoxin
LSRRERQVSDDDPVESRMNRTLVVCFSRDGHTRGLAREIAKACGGELEEIVELRGRAGWWGYLRSAIEALLHFTPALQPARHVPRQDDLVVIGTPVWCWNIASPVRSYLLTYRSQLGRVAFFCTCGGSGTRKVLRDLQALLGHAPVATLALTERQCLPGRHEAELAAFVTALKRGRALMHVPHAPRPARKPS